jgi:hypothetical protein
VRLPRSTDDLRGLRAARWLRESTERQHDRFGPGAQREQQDLAIARYGVVDTGIEWSVAHSGRTIGRTDRMRTVAHQPCPSARSEPRAHALHRGDRRHIVTVREGGRIVRCEWWWEPATGPCLPGPRC